MAFDNRAWHHRFREQTRWTEAVRARWFDHIDLPHAAQILEVGCGTGALLEQIPSSPFTRLFGVDISHERLAFAASITPRALLLQSDTHALPFASGSIDIVLTQYFFLWIQDPLAALREIRRVIRPGGYLLALAEPDYGARIDYPEALAPLGQTQTVELRRQGADPLAGRKIASYFADAGLQVRETCILGGQWRPGADDSVREDEWRVLQADVGERLDPDELSRLAAIDQHSRLDGYRVLFVPTFCVLAQNPT